MAVLPYPTTDPEVACSSPVPTVAKPLARMLVFDVGFMIEGQQVCRRSRWGSPKGGRLEGVLFCGARPSFVEPIPLLWSPPLFCGARPSFVEPTPLLWSPPLFYGAHPSFVEPKRNSRSPNEPALLSD